MTRIVKGPAEPVGDPQIAPHHFRWDANDPPITTYVEWKKAEPYKPGDIVWVQVGEDAVRARIVMIHFTRDRFGDPRSKYRVQIETRNGHWSRQWIYTYPGFIQRGYALAGATDPIDAELILS